MERNYLVIDLGTGNSRVGIVSSTGKIYDITSFENVYYRDDIYEDAQYFLPKEWEQQILDGCSEVIHRHPELKIDAIISAGARESIVLYNKEGNAFYGLPNIDNRGREWVKEIPDKSYIYERTGRWVTEDFPAAKLLGFRKLHEKEYNSIGKITSLSEWIGEIFTGRIVMEPSQACETQLFDIGTREWSKRICEDYGISRNILPEIASAGTNIGTVIPSICTELGISNEAIFIVGGADTQIAIKGTSIEAGDVGIVSGTTSPVVTIVEEKYYDEEERCWTDSNLGGLTYQVEMNPGVTGLNYQRIKKVLVPDMSYDELDKCMEQKKEFFCTASFSSLNFSKKQSLKTGGFVMGASFNASVERTDLIWAVVADIACSTYTQYRNLCEMIPHKKDCILGCGGGFQSRILCQMIADLTGKELVIREGFEQASINGCVKVCNEYFGIQMEEGQVKEQRYKPQEDSLIQRHYFVWSKNRQMLNPTD